MERNQIKIQNITIEEYNKSIKSLKDIWKKINRDVTKKDEQLLKYTNYLFNMLITLTANSEVIITQ